MKWNLGSIPENAILVTMDMVSLCPRIPHEIKVADFVLKNNYFEFNRQIKQQISGVAI